MMVGFFDVGIPAEMDKWQFFERGAMPASAKHP
jgi:hypothetical protein